MRTKLMVGAALVGILALGTYLYLHNRTAPIPSQEGAVGLEPNIADDKNSTQQANQDYLSLESGVVDQYTGTYELVNREGWDDVQQCNTLVVMSGNPEVIGYFMRSIEDGNTVHTLTPEGNLRINLPWDEMNESVRTKVRSGDTVTLELVTKKLHGKGAWPCFSFFNFVALK